MISVKLAFDEEWRFLEKQKFWLLKSTDERYVPMRASEITAWHTLLLYSFQQRGFGDYACFGISRRLNKRPIFNKNGRTDATDKITLMWETSEVRQLWQQICAVAEAYESDVWEELGIDDRLPRTK